MHRAGNNSAVRRRPPLDLPPLRPKDSLSMIARRYTISPSMPETTVRFTSFPRTEPPPDFIPKVLTVVHSAEEERRGCRVEGVARR